MLPDALLIVRKLTQVFDDLGIPYLIGGSFASSVHGLPRATRDVDFVADIRLEHVDPLVAALDAEFYVDGQTIRAAIASRRSFNLIHLETMYKADVFVKPPDPWAREQFRRRKLRRLQSEAETSTAYVSSAEDIILQKLRRFQKGGGVSTQQLADIQGILSVQADSLDYNYLRHWASELGLTELLNQSLAAAGMTADENQ